MASVVFPAMTTAQEVKIKRLIDSINEYMGADITIETCVVMKIVYPDNRKDAECVLHAILERWENKKGGENG